jgi:dipeptidyl aminopeptidase/acylaminoacyl peptidase
VYDCDTAELTTSQRVAFARSGLYYGAETNLVHYDVKAKTSESAVLGQDPMFLAVSPDGNELAFSTCRAHYELARLESGETLALPPIDAIAMPAVGPHGELAYPLPVAGDVQLAVADAAGGRRRVLTSGPREVSDVAFSPDGRYVVFHDTRPVTGGLFVADIADSRAPLRISADPRDASPVWLDQERIAFQRSEAGFTYGRIQLAYADGRGLQQIARNDAAILGAVTARHSLLVFEGRGAGDVFYEQALDGTRRTLTFAGVTTKERVTWVVASVSGRFIGWITGSTAWVGDLETMRAREVTTERVARRRAVIPDDDGNVVVLWKVKAGDLYLADGTFP